MNSWSMVSIRSDGTGTLGGITAFWNGQPQVCDPLLTQYLTDNLQNKTIISPVETSLGDLKHFTNPDGSDPPPNHYYFKGQMVNLTLWNQAIPDDDVAALYDIGRQGDPRSNPSASNLADWYRMQGNLNDSVGLNNAAGTDITYAFDP